MNKFFLFPLLLTNFFFLLPEGAGAGTITISHRDNIDFTFTNWADSLTIPQYNPALHSNQPLVGVSLELEARVRGQYTLNNTGVSNIDYGSRSRSVIVDVSAGNPALITDFLYSSAYDVGQGSLTPGQSLQIPINGEFQERQTVDPANFNLYTGTGNLDFAGAAESIIEVSISGTPFEQMADVEAYLEIVVNYSFDDPPPPPLEIDEPYLGIFSLIALGLGGLFLGSKPSQA